MNSLIEKGIITEMACGNNFAYILNENTDFLSTEYKVLHSQRDSCFAKCMKMLYNGKIQFYYMVNSLKSLADMIGNLDAEGFMTIVSNLLGNIMDVKNNGFLSCQNIDISYEHIYIDPNTYMVKLVYLPVSKRFFEDSFSFENELRTGLVKHILDLSNLSSPKVAQFTSDLSNGMLSLEDLYNRVKGGTSGILIRNDSLHRREMPSGGSLKIVAMNAPHRVEIEVTKSDFIIGKNAALADGTVSFNKMISRKHCKVIKNGSQYQIADLQSANGTYVNRVRLQPNQPYPIKNGYIIRMANSDFQVVIQ